MAASLASSLEFAVVSRRLVVDMVFANLLAIFMIAMFLGGCSMQQNPAERPDWSLNGPDRASTARAPVPPTGQRYGNWNGPGAPKPLTN